MAFLAIYPAEITCLYFQSGRDICLGLRNIRVILYPFLKNNFKHLAVLPFVYHLHTYL